MPLLSPLRRWSVAIDTKAKGKVVQVIGVVVEKDSGPIVVEVEQHMGNNWVRCVAMDSTDGLRRGAEVIDTGSPIQVPVGPKTLGRLFNVLGQPIDGKGPVEAEQKFPIHRPAPSFEEQATEAQVFETGLKVIDLIAT